MSHFSRRLALLADPAHQPLLGQCLHGIERECLRVDPHGQLALTPHPAALGSALTHPQITTDYSEALLEFITSTARDPRQVLDELEQIHRFAYTGLDDEYLWSASMPGTLPAEADIPVARYGHSNAGQLKHVYRQGLARRYGKAMQCIAGIHYNFSLPEALWQVLQQDCGDPAAPQDFQTRSYIALIRNFRRYSWLLMYLFGASPALDRNFLRQADHRLERLDSQTLYLPHATSLRMSDLGYQNHAQAGLTPCYDSLESYTTSLLKAVSTPWPAYEQIGTRQNGEWIQLNTHILQIENEYYSSIRPKRVTRSGERPLQALRERGIQYVEVRLLDINPELPLGLDIGQARFIDAFLIYCALQDSPLLQGPECSQCSTNFLSVVREGRRPGLLLQRLAGPVSLVDWAHELLEGIRPVARLLDGLQPDGPHQQAVATGQRKIGNPELTPSARQLACLREQSLSFRDYALHCSQQHARFFREPPLDSATLQAFRQKSADSLAGQARIEAADQMPFAQYLAHYQNSLPAS